MGDDGLAQAEKDIFWDVLRERDDYRARAGEAVRRVEAESGRQVDYEGALVAYVLPVDAWRAIRAMLQREPSVPWQREPLGPTAPPHPGADRD